ncbi:MAG TPA: ChbG/HpnK family deacetylase [Blastocatellia bacterium]|nr:ChbG/HpnK family deacetylase [Blastocatellia bacterium]
MKQVIINGDDFGLSDGISSGIVHCMHHGCVSSTTIMPCVDGAMERLEQWESRITGSLGVHLQLTCGKPRSPIETINSLLVNNAFPVDVEAVEDLSVDEVEKEWSAQIEAVMEGGRAITHLDSHHGHHRCDRLIDVYVRLAQRYGLAARGGSQEVCRRLSDNGVVTTDLCDSRWLRGEKTVDRFVNLLLEDFDQLGGDGTVEIVTHPGFVDDGLHKVTRYSEQRGKELEVLCSKELVTCLRRNGIELINYGTLLDQSESRTIS